MIPEAASPRLLPARYLLLLVLASASPALAQAPDTVAVATTDSAVTTSAPADTELAGPRISKLSIGLLPDTGAALPADTGRVRRHAIEYSNGYATRLTIHRIASYAELPLFAGEWILGQKLLTDERLPGRPPRGLRDGHRLVATGLEVLFGVNTVTGVWNLLESRHDPAGRTRRTIHAVSMLLADAGFLYTASLAHGARHTIGGANNHRNAAIVSISVATASTLMMWMWKQ